MLYIGIDLGTSAVKLLLMDSEGNIRNIVSREYPLYFPHPGWSEQKPEDWYEQTMEGIRELLKDADKSQVAGISFGGQMHGLVILDEKDQVIRPAILWNDGRTTEECDYLNNVIGKEKLSEYTANISFTGFTAVNRVDDFAYTPQQNIGHAMTTFLAQNKGAGHKERMKKGFQTGLLIELVYSIGLFCVIWGLAPQIMTLFAEDGDAQVVSLGISYLHLISWMYILPGLTNGVQGFFRGIGDLKVTLYSTFMNMFGRVVAVFVMIRLLQMEFASLAWANMVGWIVMLLFEVPLLVKSMRNGECG